MSSFLKPLLGLLVSLVLMAAMPAGALAQVHAHSEENGQTVVRSLESLRDLDYQSWQVVAYREGEPGGPLKLRIVGYPGKVRLDHPTALQVQSGRGHWDLEDITLANPQLADAPHPSAPALAPLDAAGPAIGGPG